MRLKTAIACLLLAAPCLAQETPSKVIAMSAEDAATCDSSDCQLITAEALKVIGAELRKVEALEEKVMQLRAELARKPNPKFCL